VLVRYFLQEFTKPGDKVFDPFAGLGTTLFVAEEMRRIPFGIEHDPRRHQWVAGQLKNWANLKYGDSAKLSFLPPAQDGFLHDLAAVHAAAPQVESVVRRKPSRRRIRSLSRR
jgi:hypothetical protein